ncbi:MAG: type II toxin-antitoxin system VapC family toxin [Actinobacteria bacterium]|nr:type II toxin-antitoxin system VapC family toxin [Actinomycetota bacterium]
MSWYFDSSAILKIIFRESNWSALSTFADQGIFTSRISRVEVLRTVARKAPELLTKSEQYLQKCSLIEVKPIILKVAEEFDPQIQLRSLDAIHIASAQGVLPLIQGLITYDKVMIKEAKALGFLVHSPGQ